jgi:hypothetical protein
MTLSNDFNLPINSILFFFIGSYNGELNNESKLEEVLQAELRSEQFLPYGKLVAWLTQELNGFYSIGEYVQDINCKE